MAVETNSTHLYADSDQERIDASNAKLRTQTILASIVEPGLSVYTQDLASPAGRPRSGAFVDGGVVTPIPALEAVRRGAERAIIVSNWTHEPSPLQKGARNAGDVFMRSLTLQTQTLAVNEVREADHAAAARRLVEYGVCKRRFARVSSLDADAVERFCQRRFHRRGELGGAPPDEHIKDGAFPWIATSWQSAWIHRPESKALAATGYSFDPDVMRPMFLEGVAEYQRRCREVHRLLGIEGCAPADRACPPYQDPLPDGRHPLTIRSCRQRAGNSNQSTSARRRAGRGTASDLHGAPRRGLAIRLHPDGGLRVLHLHVVQRVEGAEERGR
jgi:hypothetical protein